MGLVLHVDGERWRAHLRATAEARDGLVPVVKGNGYGFGLARLARKSAWLGTDTVAVGTPFEVDDVATRFTGDILVLTPWRAFDADAVDLAHASRVIHTISGRDELDGLLAVNPNPRIVLERMTSMKRHGFTARGLRVAVDEVRAHPAIRLEGASFHLPLAPRAGNLAEAEALMTDVVAAGLGNGQVWVSHLGVSDVSALSTRYPDVRLRQRIGTELWLGDRDALTVRAHVLDRHPVERGEVFGYRGRTASREGTILVVSGGTSHGIGLEAPTGDASVRARASALARGGLDAAGLARSPFTIDGKPRYFAEPPHMQASMLFLPSGVAVPEIGEVVDVRVRHTATTFDRVEIS
ncbi:MAG: alanine racemase domain protein [Marmoricola sp.]|nr:alanine racemase domain protein [Marmoricola sp.]